MVHAIGDRANAVVLDIFEKLEQARGRTRPAPAHRARAGRARRRQGCGSRRLGVIASIQPSHCIDDMRWAEKRIGRDRVRIAYDFKSFVDAGVRMSFGTDWFVEPLNPMLGLYAAVTRQFPDGTPPGGWFPEERHDAGSRPSSSTRSARPMPSSPSAEGPPEPGYLADLVVLSKPTSSTCRQRDSRRRTRS